MENISKTMEKYMEAVINQLNRMDKKMDIIVKTKETSDRDEYLDNQDICIMLGVTKKTLYRYRKKGILKSYSFDGRKMYYKKSEIPNNLKARKRQ